MAIYIEKIVINIYNLLLSTTKKKYLFRFSYLLHECNISLTFSPFLSYFSIHNVVLNDYYSYSSCCCRCAFLLIFFFAIDTCNNSSQTIYIHIIEQNSSIYISKNSDMNHNERQKNMCVCVVENERNFIFDNSSHKTVNSVSFYFFFVFVL
jgi:hypothetical protein